MLSVLFPARCPVCQQIVKIPGEKICPDCREEIAFVQEPACRLCGKEITGWEQDICYDCGRHHRSFRGGVSLMNYDEIGQKTMKAFKFGGRQEYAAFYIEEILRRYRDRMEAFGADAILPVPVHISKMRSRGYNQAELLAGELSEKLDIPLRCDLLLRTRKTVAQKELNAAQRQKNLESAMEVCGDTEGIERVILVDDIYTTGSTMEACTRVLARAGISEVFILTVCIGNNK